MLSLNAKVIEKFYYTTIIPSITYNIAIWGSCSLTKLAKLDEIHAKAAKIIHRLPDNLSTNQILDKVNWMPISYLYKRRLLCLMHQVFYKLTDPDIYLMFTTTNPVRETRRKLILNSKDNIGCKNSFSYRGCKLWNSMPFDLTSIQTHHKFKRHLYLYKDQINSYSFEYDSYNIGKGFTFI